MSETLQSNTSPQTLFLSLCSRWAKDRRVVLVSSNERKKWTTVRPLPTKKPIPSQFEVSANLSFFFFVCFPPRLFESNITKPAAVINGFSFLDLHACDSWQEVSVHWKLHVRSQWRRKRPLDLHEGKQQ